MMGFSIEELWIVAQVRALTGEETDEYECLESWEEMESKF